MSFNKTFIFLLILGVSSHAAADLFVQTGMHFGGDKVATVTFVGGETESITAGGLLSFSAGYEADISDSFLARFSVGYKFNTVNAKNGSLDFTRVPLEAILFKKSKSFLFGIGLTQHNNVEVSGDGFASSANAKFDNATGLVLQVDYLLGKRGYVNLKYTSIDYRPVGGTKDFDGSSFGFGVGYRLGK